MKDTNTNENNGVPNATTNIGGIEISDAKDSNITGEGGITTHVDTGGGDIVVGDKIITHVYEAPPLPLPPAEARERRDLGILLGKVKQFWIEGVLEKSIHTIALIDLGKESQAEAVAHAWEQVLELPDQSRQTLPPDKKISHIFDEMNRALLILGAPGSGKIITLLQPGPRPQKLFKTTSLSETYDFSAAEQVLAEILNRFSASVLKMMLNQLNQCPIVEPP